MSVEFQAGELKELNVALIPIPALEWVDHPYVRFQGVYYPVSYSMPYVDYDFFAGAELTVGVSGRYGTGEEGAGGGYTFEFSLIKGDQVIPIGSASRSVNERTTTGIPDIFITLPSQTGTYDSMLRVYKDGELIAQYPYLSTWLGMITVLPKGVSNFSYSKPSLVVKWDDWWTRWTYAVTGTITNVGSTTEERYVVLWISVTDDWLHCWYRKHEFLLRLAPGQSYNYSHLPKHNVNDPDWDIIQAGSVGNKLQAQFRDSDGKTSAKSDIEIAPD